jgi:hypothetical protein
MENDDDDYSAEQRARISTLSDSQIAAVDAEILAVATADWRKVARVIGSVMATIYLPDVFVSERVQALVSKGMLESRGNLRRMQFSEVRLPQ